MHQSVLCGVNFADFLIRMEEFHGYRSPGLVLGARMLDIALEELGTTPHLNVVTETVVCLPDAVQLLTPCTLGNGFLQVFDWGKFALTSYDRVNLSGVRVCLNHNALTDYPLIHRWFERSGRPKEKPPFEPLASEILVASADILSHKPVRLHRALKDSERVPTARCPACGESYALRLGSLCPACRSEAYYEHQPKTDKHSMG